MLLVEQHANSPSDAGTDLGPERSKLVPEHQLNVERDSTHSSLLMRRVVSQVADYLLQEFMRQTNKRCWTNSN